MYPDTSNLPCFDIGLTYLLIWQVTRY